MSDSIQEMRQTILSEQQLIASKQRFALFSHPPPLAIGDDGMYKSKKAIRGEDGKPKTLPRNLLAGQNLKGVTKSSFLSYPQSIHKGDLYQDEYKRELTYQLTNHSRGKMHQTEFKPSSGVKSLVKAAYDYQAHGTIEKKPHPCDDNGRVLVAPKNVTTNPSSKVTTDYMKPEKYVSDPYERKREIERQQRELSKKKMPEYSFRSMSHGNLHFTKQKQIYGIDDKAKQIMRSKSPFGMSAPRSFHHEAKFKLARRGHGDPLGKYPQYIAKKLEQNPQKKKIRTKEEAWRPNGDKSLSRPTPSISMMNLRRGR